MSLQKIQVELSVIKKVAEPIAAGEFDLGFKIWQDFKDWRNQPKYIRKQHTSALGARSRVASQDLRRPGKAKADKKLNVQPDESAEQLLLLPGLGAHSQKSLAVGREDSLAVERDAKQRTLSVDVRKN
jgi:hypothetical protein